jgi:hypothetical protein
MKKLVIVITLLISNLALASSSSTKELANCQKNARFYTDINTKFDNETVDLKIFLGQFERQALIAKYRTIKLKNLVEFDFGTFKQNEIDRLKRGISSFRSRVLQAKRVKNKQIYLRKKTSLQFNYKITLKEAGNAIHSICDEFEGIIKYVEDLYKTNEK